jgi:hypothetical protein
MFCMQMVWDLYTLCKCQSHNEIYLHSCRCKCLISICMCVNVSVKPCKFILSHVKKQYIYMVLPGYVKQSKCKTKIFM